MPRPQKYLLRDLTLGWIPDPPSEAIAHQAWADATNVRFRNRGVERIRDSGQYGSQTLTYKVAAAGGGGADTADPVTGLPQYNSGTASTMLCFTTKEIYKEQSTAGSPWDTGQGDRLGVRYILGQASCPGGSTTVTGDAVANWTTGADAKYLPKVGDWMAFASDAYATWYQILTVDSATQITLTTNGPNTGGVVNYRIRLLNTGAYNNAWLACEYHHPDNAGQSIMIATNGVDPLMYWTGSGQFQHLLSATEDLEGYTASTLTQGLKARALCVWRNLVWIGDTTEDGTRRPYRLRCCNLLNCFGTNGALVKGWIQPAIGTDYANAWDLPWGGDRIMALVPLSGDTMLVYKERSIWAVMWRGLDFGIADFIQITEVTASQGCMSRTSVASNGLVHCFADSQNIYLRSVGYAANIVPIGDTVRKYYIDRVNRAGGDINRVFWRADANEFWIMFADEPGASPGVTEALILYLPNGEWRPDIGELAIPVWSRADLTGCTTAGRQLTNRSLTWAELAGLYGTWSAIPAGTKWQDLYVETEGLYIWGDVNGRTYYFEKDASEGSYSVARTGQLDSKLHSLGDPTVPKMIFQPTILTDSDSLLVKARVAISETPHWGNATIYGKDGISGGTQFKAGDSSRLYGKYAGLRFYLYKGDNEEMVRLHGYGFVYVAGGKAR